MKKLLCPQCKIAGMYVKNDQGERLLVYIAQDGTVVPKYPEIPIEGFDLVLIYISTLENHRKAGVGKQ